MRSYGTISKDHGFDVVTIELQFAPGIDEPQSYGGVSGGGVWLTFVSEDGKQDVDRRLMAVACREVIGPGESIVIECYVPNTIYNDLIKGVRERFGAARNLEFS